MIKSSELKTAADVAALFNVSTATVHRWCREGEIEFIEVGPSKTRRFTPDHIAIVAGAYDDSHNPITDLLDDAARQLKALTTTLAKLREQRRVAGELTSPRRAEPRP